MNSVIYDGNDPLTHTNVTLTHIVVAGLDSFTEFNPLEPLGNFTLLNDIAMRSISVKANITIVMSPTEAAGAVAASHETVTEHIMIETGLRQVGLSLATLLAVDGTSCKMLQLGSLVDSPLGCLFSTVIEANATSLNLTLDNIIDPTLVGFISPGLDALFSNIAHAAFLLYKDAVLTALPEMMQTTVRQLLNQWINSSVAMEQAKACPVPVKSKQPQIMDLTQTWLVKELNWLLNEYLGATKMNTKVIAPATKAQSGTSGQLMFQGSLLGGPTVPSSAQIGAITIDIGNLTLSGLDTIYNMSLFHALSPHEVVNLLSIGYPRELELKIDVLARIEPTVNTTGSIQTMNDKFSLSIGNRNLSAVLDTGLELNSYKLWSLTVAEMMSGLGCWLSTLDDASFQAVSAKWGTFSLGLDCHSWLYAIHHSAGR